MHSSRMRTGRTFTVFQKLETPPSLPPRKFGADPPENLEQTLPPENLEQTPPHQKFGADTTSL